MVYNVLGSIQEKVEAQQSAGLDAARGRIGERPRGQDKPGEKDKLAARSLLWGKARVKRKKKDKPLLRQVWFQAVGLLLLLAGVGLALWVALRPPSAERLYQRAEKLMAAADYESHEKARSGPIKQYLAHYRDRPGEQTEQVKRWNDQAQVEGCEDLVQRYRAKRHSAIKFEAQSETERRAFRATDAEDNGDVQSATQMWQEIAQAAQGQAWGLLAERRLQALKDTEKLEDDLLTDLHLNLERGREPQLSGLAEKALTALRYAQFGDVDMAKRRLEDLKKEADQPGQRAWFLLAARKLEQLKQSGGAAGSESPEERREKLVKEKVEQAEAELQTSVIKPRATCLDIIALYGNDDKLKAPVDKARKLLRQTAGQ
jgi:hypothetical protein